MNPDDFTPEWAEHTLKALGHTPGRPLRDYMPPADWPACKLALSVLKQARKGRAASFVLTGAARSGGPVVLTRITPNTTPSRALPWAS